MGSTRDFTFGRFRFDVSGERVWDGPQSLPLRPKAFAVLQYLVARPGELVTKQELLDAVWPSTYVTDGVLKDCIRQLRDVLGDDAAKPEYIETAHRRGYRFIAEIQAPATATTATPGTLAAAASASAAGATTHMPAAAHGLAAAAAAAIAPATLATPAPATPVPATPVPATPATPGDPARLQTLPPLASPPRPNVLGREAELTQLREWLSRALAGERQIVFVTGEPGIGKTTIVNELIDRASETGGMWIARGQCLEQLGAGEAYLPVLDAFSRLGKTTDGTRLIARLREHAPAWLLELPSLLPAGEREALRQQVAGVSATRERMLREMTEAIDAITAEVPLMLVLEDLHWSDYSTLDLIAYLARRRDPARLMLIGTYRPVEVNVGAHPLKNVRRELQAHRLCQDLPLTALTEPAVAEYLSARLSRAAAAATGPHSVPRRLARMVHRRTEGNPLFMVNVVSYLLDNQILVERHGAWRLRDGVEAAESGVPESIRQLIEQQIERLNPDERRVLEGASAVGMECSSVAIAAGLDVPRAWVEEQCEALVRKHQFLSPARLVELPDGTITPRYRFSHVLYLDVPYSLMPAMQRAQIHGRIGRSGEQVYATRLEEIATELAVHFEQAHYRGRALKYLLMSAEIAIHRCANHEAGNLARRGLRALAALPDTPERAADEYRLQMTLAASLMATRGVAAEGLDEACARAYALCRDPKSPQAFMARWMRGLSLFFRAEMHQALPLANELLTLATAKQDPALLIEGHRPVGVTLMEMGRFREALHHFDQLERLYRTSPRVTSVPFSSHDPQVVAHVYAARAAWALGEETQALEHLSRARTMADQLSHAETLILAMNMAAMVHQLRGDAASTQEHAESAIAMADEYGMQIWTDFGNILRGWALVAKGAIDEGLGELRRGLAAFDATGVKLWRPFFLGLLAEGLGRAGHLDEGFAVSAEAIAQAHATGARASLAELYRIQSELLAASGNPDGATASLEQALAIARAQEAIAIERRILETRTTR